MLVYQDVSGLTITLQEKRANNDHIGSLLEIAAHLEDEVLVESLSLLKKLVSCEGVTRELRPLRDLLERTTLDSARARMSADAFRAVYRSL